MRFAMLLVDGNPVSALAHDDVFDRNQAEFIGRNNSRLNRVALFQIRIEPLVLLPGTGLELRSGAA